MLVMGVLGYLLTGLKSTAADNRQAQTQTALTQAREALIAWSMRDWYKKSIDPDEPHTMFGYLPLPDLGSERNGNNDPNCRNGADFLEGCDFNDSNDPNAAGITFDVNGIGPTVIGRLPWRTLGIGPLRDGYGECLWLVVSSLHGRMMRSSPVPIPPPMNWDTLGQIDIVTADGTDALSPALTNAHGRPVAIIFSPGAPLPGQDRSRSSTADVTECGGNYDAKNYLDPAVATALGGVYNYLSGINNATGTTGDSNPSNDPDTPKPMALQGKVFDAGGSFLANGCAAGDCALTSNDLGLALTSDTLFGSIRKFYDFRLDLNETIEGVRNCLRDDEAAGGGGFPLDGSGFTPPAAPPADMTVGRARNDSACFASPLLKAYFDNYKDMMLVARRNTGTTDLSIAGSATECAGVLLFASQRAGAQSRVTQLEKRNPANYLEGVNLARFSVAGTVFDGPDRFDRSPPQSPEQDIVLCIPSGASDPEAVPTLRTVQSSELAGQGFDQLVDYDPDRRTLTLGAEGVTTGGGATADALFGCAWANDVEQVGRGIRVYFRFQFRQVESDVGDNGFVFTLADSEQNSNQSCGAAGSHLGYSGNNGRTPSVRFPKIGIEFDQGRNAGFNRITDDPDDPGRNDPCGTFGCGGTAGFNSHAAIVYWGHEAPNDTDHSRRPPRPMIIATTTTSTAFRHREAFRASFVRLPGTRAILRTA